MVAIQGKMRGKNATDIYIYVCMYWVVEMRVINLKMFEWSHCGKQPSVSLISCAIIIYPLFSSSFRRGGRAAPRQQLQGHTQQL